MSNNPINLLIRFVLEIILLVIFAYWGSHTHFPFPSIFVAVGLPLIAAIIWGVFRVEGDPGKATVAIPGWLRLTYEMILFCSATVMLYKLGLNNYGTIFLIIWVVHYIVSYDRVLLLLKRR